MKKLFASIVVLGTLCGAGLAAFDAACTPAQSAALGADAQEAVAILNTLDPVACAIVDDVDPANGQAICQVVTDVATGATALVPIFGTVAALTQVVAAKPANAAVTQAVVGLSAAQRAAQRAALRSLAAKRVRR